MKKILPVLASVVLFAACQTEKKDVDVNKDFMLMDTARIYPSNVSADTGIAAVAPVSPQVNNEPPVVRQTTTTPRKRTNTPVPQNNQPVVQTPQPTNTNTNPAPVPDATASTGTGTKPDTVATAPAKKKGWSDAAKGATIGGVGGAVIGGVIGKNAKGAVIGGVIGAAGGYILGRKKDKASGRVDTTKN